MATPEDGAAQARRAPLARLARDLVVYGLGDALVKSSALLTMPLYTRAFGPEGYGVWGLAVTGAALAQVALGLGLESAYARYYFQAGEEERPRLTGTALLLAFAPALLMALLLAAVAPSFMRGYLGGGGGGLALALALAGVPFGIANGLAGQVLRNRFEAARFSQLNFLSGALQIGLSLTFALGLGRGVAGVMAGILLGQMLMLPLRLWGLRGDLAWVVDGAWARKLLAYGLPLVPTSLAFWVFSAADRYVLGWLSNVAETGRYSVAATLTGALAVVSAALGQAWSPISLQLYERDPELARSFYGQVLVYLVAGFGAMAMAMALVGPELVALAAAPEFAAAAGGLGPLALSVGALATTQVTAAGISLSGKTGYFAAYAWVAAVLNFVLNLALVPQGGLVASAWATFATSLCLSLAYAATTQRLWPLRHRLGPLLAAACPPVMLVVALPWLPLPPGWLGLAARLGLFLAYPLWLLLTGVLGEDEWAALARRLGWAKPPAQA